MHKIIRKKLYKFLHHDCAKIVEILYYIQNMITKLWSFKVHIKARHIWELRQKLKHKKNENEKRWIIDAARGQLFQHNQQTEVKDTIQVH